MGAPLTKNDVACTKREQWAITLLAEHFKCGETEAEVFTAVFAWYYVPLSTERMAYAKRVVEAALTALEPPNPAGYPDWFWRVYEMVIEHSPAGEKSIPPPPDPKTTH